MDLPIFLALLTPLLVIAIHLPLIMAFRRMSPTYWPASTSWTRLLEFYFQFALIPLATMFVALVLFAAFDSPEGRRLFSFVLPPYEWAAMGAMALMPIAVLAISKYTTHVFAPRYVLPTNIGVGILAACILRIGSRKQSNYALAVLGFLLLAGVLQQFFFTTSFNLLHTTYLRSDSGLREGEGMRRELRALPDTSEPIVVAYCADFLELSYYGEPPLRRRVVYLLSRNLNLQYNGFDLDYVNLLVMRKRTTLAILELDAFLSANPHFILAVEPTRDYLSSYLRSEGYRLVALDSNSVPNALRGSASVRERREAIADLCRLKAPSMIRTPQLDLLLRHCGHADHAGKLHLHPARYEQLRDGRQILHHRDLHCGSSGQLVGVGGMKPRDQAVHAQGKRRCDCQIDHEKRSPSPSVASAVIATTVSAIGLNHFGL